MKNSRICPKCGSERVVKVSDGDLMPNRGVRLPCGALNSAGADLLICCDCGYTELWMPKDKLEKIYNMYHDDSN